MFVGGDAQSDFSGIGAEPVCKGCNSDVVLPKGGNQTRGGRAGYYSYQFSTSGSFGQGGAGNYYGAGGGGG